jgi:hypothetical protein
VRSRLGNCHAVHRLAGRRENIVQAFTSSKVDLLAQKVEQRR